MDAEGRQSTFVEEREHDGRVEYVKTYVMRLTATELLTALDAWTEVGNGKGYSSSSLRFNTRQLRQKVLATLGLVEEG